MLYSPKCPRGCVVAKGQWKGEPRTPAQALHWSNHLTALLSQLPNYGWKENTRNYVKPTLTANLSSEHGCSTWAMLPDCGSQSRSGNVPFMALVPGFAVTFQACLIHELPACPEPVQPKPLVEFGVVRPKRRKMRYAYASLLGLCPRKRNSCLQVDIEMQHNTRTLSPLWHLSSGRDRQWFWWWKSLSTTSHHLGTEFQEASESMWIGRFNQKGVQYHPVVIQVIGHFVTGESNAKKRGCYRSYRLGNDMDQW